MVRAYGSDDVQHVHDTASGVAVVRIGRLTWPLHDQAAWATATATWRQVADIALWSWPRSTPAPRHPPRHRTRRGASTLPSMTWKELSGTDGLITGVASGRRVMWIVRLPAGRVVRGDITINATTSTCHPPGRWPGLPPRCSCCPLSRSLLLCCWDCGLRPESPVQPPG